MPKKNYHTVEDRLIYLHSIKSDLVIKQSEWKENYIGNQTIPDDPYKSSYRTGAIFSIINAKAAELLSGIQEYDFMPLDDTALRNVHLIKKIWDYEWIQSRTDKQLSNVFYSALKYGDGFLYEGTRRVDRKIKTPYYDEGGTMKYKEELVTEYDGIYSEYIPWENFYFDGYDIDSANEAIWIKYWDRKSFINTFGENPNYKSVNEDIPVGRHYYVTSGNNLSLDGNLNDENIITELRYYNKSNDELIILANGVEVYNNCIPYKHKELPFCVFSDYKLDNRTYSMGEYELLEKDEKYKDALRSLSIDVIKAQFGFTAIDPDADFDEATVEIGTNSFARINPRDIAHFSPNINANSILQAENQADNDMIIKSGIDFKSQILGPSETATKVAAKTQSARKRINLNLKMNGYSFFERLARLRMSNLQLEYSKGYKKIPIKGGNIDSKGTFTPVNGGYGSFTVKPEYVKGKFNIMPITESILGINSEREKVRILEFSQIAGNIVGQDGKPIIKPERLVEELSRRFGVDFEKLTQQSEAYQNPEDMLKELEQQGEGITPGGAADPDYIPPEQRSGAMSAVPKIGGMSNSLPLE